MSEDISTIDVLLVEDNPGDERLVGVALAESQVSFAVTTTSSLAGALEELGDGSFDLVLLDLNLPDSRGIDTFHRVNAVTKLPIVVFTVLGNEEDGLAAVRAGAQDYLVKEEVDHRLLMTPPVHPAPGARWGRSHRAPQTSVGPR